MAVATLRILTSETEFAKLGYETEYAKILVEMESKYRDLPSVDRILSQDEIKRLIESYPHDLIVNLARERLELERASISRGPIPGKDSGSGWLTFRSNII